MSEWIEIAVGISDDDALPADELAATIAPGGVELREREIVFWVEVDQAEVALAETRTALVALNLDPNAVSARPAAPEAEWRDAWKRYFHVERVTDRIVIVPSWETYEAAPPDVVLDLDPGQAFGTGSHATTRLCLAAIDRLSASGVEPAQFLDLGTGSGILAIAAAKFWPHAVGVALDIDPLAVSAASENVGINGVEARVRCADTPVGDLSEEFDLVLANIRADVHLALRGDIAARLAPGGHLILSGLLTEQAREVAAAFAELGLRVEDVRAADRDPAWSSVELTR